MVLNNRQLEISVLAWLQRSTMGTLTAAGKKPTDSGFPQIYSCKSSTVLNLCPLFPGATAKNCGRVPSYNCIIPHSILPFHIFTFISSQEADIKNQKRLRGLRSPALHICLDQFLLTDAM